MEVYILDATLHRSAVIDNFESLIWTERFSAYGDFELVIQATTANRMLLSIGTRLVIPNSYRVMVIETVENKSESLEQSRLLIKGRSLESILEDRVAKKTMSNLTLEPQWVLTGTPGAIVREIFQTICVNGALSINDIIPFVVTGNVFPPDTILEVDDILSLKLDTNSVYNVIKELCDIYNLGFRLVRDLDLPQLYFNVYSGNDHTTAQSILPAVVFSPNLDNLAGASELTSTEKYKNIAYVFAPNGFEIVYAIGADATTAGFDRRVIFVDASGVSEPAGQVLTSILQQKGREALSKAKNVSVFDGELPQTSKYRYGIDYQLGDLLEMRNSSGVINYMRVTEQIFVSDAEGERSYPTLETRVYVTLGSWYAREHNVLIWENMPVAPAVDGFWDNE